MGGAGEEKIRHVKTTRRVHEECDENDTMLGIWLMCKSLNKPLSVIEEMQVSLPTSFTALQ